MKRLFLLLIISLSVSSFLAANTAKAVCAEAIVKDENGNDRIFSTFGEGRCPPGSKTAFGSSSKSDLDRSIDRLNEIQAPFKAANNAIIAFSTIRNNQIDAEARKQVASTDIKLISYAVPNADKYVLRMNFEPRIGEEFSRESGDSVISGVMGYFSDCVIPRFSFEGKRMGGHLMSIQKDVPACKKASKNKIYTPPYLNSYTKKTDTVAVYDYKIKIKRNKYQICHHMMGFCQGSVKNLSKDDFSFVTGFVSNPFLSQKQFIYIGRYTNLISFIYRYKNDNQSTFNIDKVDFDLTKSNILEHEGAKIEVIGATESELTFKVLSYFN
ncbi:hypothetical protein N9T32_00050 [bacterium]|nr:hypothetical protein [bacterium]